MTRRRIQFIMLFSVLVVATLATTAPVSSIETVIAISPRIVTKPSGNFQVNITLTNAELLYAWQVNLTFSKDVVKLVSFKEGDFLARQPLARLIASNIKDSWALLGVSTQGSYIGLSGSGTLATLEFQILGQGVSPLEIEETNRTFLRAQTSPQPPPNWQMLPYTVENGVFLNTITPPVSSFDYSPSAPAIGQNITFDASSSSASSPYAIVEYFWDFGDDTNATVTTATTQHAYSEGGSYTVKLTVIDNATAPPEVASLFGTTGMPRLWYDLFGTSSKSVGVTISHDILLTDITVSKQEVTAGETIQVTVTALNQGIEPETFDVTTYYGETKIDTKQVTDLGSGEEEELVFDWNTAGVAGGSYRIKAVASSVEGEINSENNEILGGTVKVSGSGSELPIIPIIGGAVAAIVVVLLVAVFLMRRRKP